MYALVNKTGKTDSYYITKDGRTVVANNTESLLSLYAGIFDTIEEYDVNKAKSNETMSVLETVEGCGTLEEQIKKLESKGE